MMVHPEQVSCQGGHNAEFAGKPSRLLKGPDELAYAGGFIEEAARETKRLASSVKRPRLRFVRKS